MAMFNYTKQKDMELMVEDVRYVRTKKKKKVTSVSVELLAIWQLKQFARKEKTCA